MAAKYNYVLLDNDCLIGVYQSCVVIFLALRFYAFSDLLCSNYAGIIGWSLIGTSLLCFLSFRLFFLAILFKLTYYSQKYSSTHLLFLVLFSIV